MSPRSKRQCTTTAERTGRKMGDVVNPLRVAVTGQGVGPGLYDCLVILGRDACQSRINANARDACRSMIFVKSLMRLSACEFS